MNINDNLWEFQGDIGIGYVYICMQFYSLYSCVYVVAHTPVTIKHI